MWDNIQKLARNRGRSLEDALAAAETFWDELTMVMKALKELQDSLNAQEPPAVEPNAIQYQQDALQVRIIHNSSTKNFVPPIHKSHHYVSNDSLMQHCSKIFKKLKYCTS